MAVASSKTVLGDFNNAKTEHFTQKATFYKEGERFKITLTEQDKVTTYEVKYTFGHYPLQQYLVPAEGGRYQVFPFAWDSRAKSEGGQRWYPNYQNEDVKANDRLHWQQGLQNWNGMCADCHSDGLTRNYDITTNHFESTWDNINVGCQSCHGKMEDHQNSPNRAKSNTVINSISEQQQALNWLLGENQSVARLSTSSGKRASVEQKRERGEFMETCFACHSLRSPLTDGIDPEQRFLDQFSPSLIAQPLYHADGQIKEEVYVYGSFLQSKMYAEGVTCLDCHDAHSMKIKTQGNALCLQCHNAEVYQQTSHTNHPLESEAGQCVTCHMPETTYMGVDARRDHSFKVPAPHYSTTYGTPNVCVDCHTDKNNQWASQQLNTWRGKPKTENVPQEQFIRLLHGGSLPLEEHLALINNPDVNEINRASAIALLPNTTPMLSDYVVKGWVTSPLPLIRLATAKVGQLLSDEDKLASYQKLLDDEFKAVRTAAAEHMITLGLKENKLFNKAFAELNEANRVSSWRGEGNLNRSLTALKQGKISEAIAALDHSIKVDPYFAPAYVNLADMYRNSQLPAQELATYRKGLRNIPNDPDLHYAYGLYLIRSGDKSSAVKSFKQAMTLNPASVQFAYVYALSLDGVGQTAKAISQLKRMLKAHNNAQQLLQLGLSLSQKIQSRQDYNYFLQRYQQP